MSFANELKREIMDSQRKKSCCKRAFLNGIIAAKAIEENHNLLINTSNQENAEFLAEQIKEVFSNVASILPPKKGGRCKTVTFKSPSAEKYLVSLNSGNALIPKCVGCESAFFRGVFWACGRISDPQKQFCLEFSIGNRENILNPIFAEPRFSTDNAMGVAVLAHRLQEE